LGLPLLVSCCCCATIRDRLKSHTLTCGNTVQQVDRASSELQYLANHWSVT
jgi:hypothetical protein